MKLQKMLNIVFLLLFSAGVVYAQSPADTNEYISKQEYEKLRQDIDTLKAQIAAMRKERTAVPAETNQVEQVKVLKSELENLKKQQAVQTEDVNETVSDFSSQLQTIKNEVELNRLGTTKFLLTGYSFAGFTDKRGQNSSFSAGFNPIFLWELSDRLLFEGELEFELTSPHGTGSSETETSLEYANFSYLLNDYMTIGAGKFLLPFGIFNERLHPAWINKLPDRPLPYDDEVGIAPEAGIGVFLRGAFPAGSTKFNYAFYIDNGPALITEDLETAGMLDFDNFEDNNHNKTIGWRLGFLPVPELEVGYSMQAGKVNPPEFETVDMFLHAFDISYLKQINSLRGTIDARAEFVWSDVGKATYGPTAALPFGPLRFDNDRNGYYVQVAYRPTLADEKILRNLEFVMRYDSLDVPSGAPGSVSEHRWTPGIDYWVNPSTVLKLAYQFDSRSGERDQNALLMQAALGF
jgi:hypothetical protein